jgi:hypothetical protein
VDSWVLLALTNIQSDRVRGSRQNPPSWLDETRSSRELRLFTNYKGSRDGYESRILLVDRRLTKFADLGGIHSIGAPIQVYPLYEHAFRAARKQLPKDNNEESARLYAEFAKVASKNPMAWSYGQPPSTEKFIGTVSKKNRMICSPCEETTFSRRCNH